MYKSIAHILNKDLNYFHIDKKDIPFSNDPTQFHATQKIFRGG